MIQRNFDLHLHAGKSNPLVINANQYDSGEQWIFTLYNHGQVFTPTTGAIVGIKSDGLAILNAGTVVDGKVVITETEQMTASKGRNYFELLIEDQTHGTANFIVLVEPRPGDNADFSESDLSLLEQAIEGTSAAAIAQGVSDWMDDNLTPTTPVVDSSLTVSGAAADAKKTGDEISALKSDLTAIENLEDSVVKVTGFQQGYRHERENASLTVNSKWVITTEPVQFKKGQVLSVQSGYEYCVVDPNSSNYGAYLVTRRSTAYTFASDTNGYLEIRVTGAASDITPEVVSGNVVSVTTSYKIVTTVNSLTERANKLVKYVSTSGSDTNDGNTSSTAYATIAKALASNAGIIYIATGTYTESIYEYTGYRYGSVKIYANEATLVNSNSLHFRLCDVEIEGLTIQSSASDSSVNGIQLLNCTGRLKDCKVSNAPNMGFVLNGCRMTLERCEAENCGVDGFNAHDVSSGYHTDCTLIDCIAHGCGDDGLSFHENGKMHVIGGEYYNNVSTGIAPHQFCDFEIRNAYIHDNGTGIEAENPDYTSGDKAQGLVIGCVIESNNKTGRAQSGHIGYGVRAKQYEIKALGNAVVGNTNGTYYQDTGGVITVYGSGDAPNGNEVYY